MAALPFILMAAGTAMSAVNTVEQGKQEKEISKQRAAIDIKNAEFARKNAEEHAKIQSERGRRLISTQQANFSAFNILTNVGSPLDVKIQTVEDINKDVGFILDQGRQQEFNYLSNANYEKQFGKSRLSQSKQSAWAQGVQGAGSIAFMGYKGGLWGGSAAKAG